MNVCYRATIIPTQKTPAARLSSKSTKLVKELPDKLNNASKRMSKPVKMRKGVPQGGQGSPGFWWEYTLDTA